MFNRFLLSSLSLAALLSSGAFNNAEAKKAKNIDIIGTSVSGKARFLSRTKVGAFSRVAITIDRLSTELDADLGRGDVLEAWLVDHGTATDSTKSSANDDDNKLVFNDDATASNFTLANSSGVSVSVANIPINNLIEAAPYALSLGVLNKNKKGNYVLSYKVRNSLRPYDYILITQESKGNRGDFDPRPGTELTRIDLPLD